MSTSAELLTQVEYLVDACEGNPDLLFERGTGLYDLIVDLAEQLKAHAAVVARLNDGWEYVRPARQALAHRRGVWWRVQDGACNWVLPAGASTIPHEPMTPAEQLAVYGEVVQ